MTAGFPGTVQAFVLVVSSIRGLLKGQHKMCEMYGSLNGWAEEWFSVLLQTPPPKQHQHLADFSGL